MYNIQFYANLQTREAVCLTILSTVDILWKMVILQLSWTYYGKMVILQLYLVIHNVVLVHCAHKNDMFA